MSAELGGFVTNHIDFQGRNQINNETPDGLFSQVIFGPKQDYKCACGNYNNSTYANQICPKCNVLCGLSNIRFTQFGKIKTIFPFIKPTKINIVTQKLGKLSKLIINPSRSDVNVINSRYLAVSYDKEKLKIVKTLNNTTGFLVIPFRITGIYSLYIALKFCANYLKIPTSIEFLNNNYFTYILKVLPPNIRMFTIDHNKNKIRMPPINKLYTSVLNCNKINLPFVSYLEDNEEQVINKILNAVKLRILDQEIIESDILEYDLKTYAYQSRINNIYKKVYELLSGKTGMIRRESLSKAVEFSARTVIKVDPSLKVYQIRVSQTILQELWAPQFLYWLTKHQKLDYNYCFDRILIENNRCSNYDELFTNFLKWFSKPEKELNRLMFLNRPPTLYAHSIPVVEVLPNYDKEDLTIGMSPLTLAPMNADLDGDTLAIFAISDNDALKEMYKKAYLKNKFKYDSNEQMLVTLRHESLYGIYILSSKKINYDKPILKINSLNELPESFDYWNLELDKPIQFNNQIYSYGMCLINKWAGITNDILINFPVSKKNSNEVSEIIFNFDNNKFHDNIYNLSNSLFFFISSTIHCPSINIDEMINIVDDSTQKLFHQLPTTNPYLGYHINEALIDRCVNNMNHSEDLYNLYKSGSRFNKSQLARTCINTGYIADAENVVNYNPIKSNLITGFNSVDFLATSLGTRKGIVDKAKSTPNSGYIQRTLSMALSPLEIIEEDCHTNYHLEFIVFSKKHAKTLSGKYYKDPNIPDMDWTLLDFSTAKKFINKKIWVRSPMTCQTENFQICKKCFGERNLTTPYIGIVAGQLISERLTQLVMRSFHTSGSCNLPINEEIKKFIEKYLINIEFINNKYILTFNHTPDILFSDIIGFESIQENKVIFKSINQKITNTDVISTLHNVNELLKTKTNNIKSPIEYYENFMASLLEVGTLFSSFVECVFANMFLVQKDPNLFWRYNQDKQIIFKAGKINLAYIVNPRLSCLFQPNSKTLKYLNSKQKVTTFYEHIWDSTFK